MSKKQSEEIQAALKQPFAPEDLEWRLQHVIEEKQRGIAVPYVTNRAIQNRLDDVVGPDNWYNDYKPWHGTGKKEAQLCGISIYFADKERWITKWDGAEDSDIEPIKGGLSDSMKRAAVQWGIGRILYEMNSVFVDVEKRGKSYCIAEKDQSKLDAAYLDLLKRKGLTLEQAPKQEQTPEAPEEKKGKSPKSKEKELPPSSAEPQDVPMASTPVQETEYTVISAVVQKGMSGTNTRMVLEGPGKKRINAFARGNHPELSEGTSLTGVRLTLKKQDTVIFYILEDFQTIPDQEAA